MVFTRVKRSLRDRLAVRKGVQARENAGIHEGAGDLIGHIFKAVHRATSWGVCELHVAWEGDQLVLSGYCRTFYTKQIAQKTAMKLLGDEMLRNDIRVS